VSGNERRFHLGEQHRLPGPVAQAATARRGVWHQGPPVARRVADNARHSSAWAAERYRQARTRGARHPRAVRVVARGWIRVIWACWHTGTAYTPSRHPRRTARSSDDLTQRTQVLPRPPALQRHPSHRDHDPTTIKVRCLTPRGGSDLARCSGPDRILLGQLPRRPRSLVIAGEALWVLLFDGEVAVGGHAGGLVGEVERAVGVGDRFGQAQRGGHGPVGEHLLAAAEE
jgi:hypothetical protein